MSAVLNDTALDQLFRSARSYNAFTGEIGDDTLRRLYDLVEADSSLWRATPVTLGDIEDGLVALEPPVVDEAQLARRWAELVTEAFCR